MSWLWSYHHLSPQAYTTTQPVSLRFCFPCADSRLLSLQQCCEAAPQLRIFQWSSMASRRKSKLLNLAFNIHANFLPKPTFIDTLQSGKLTHPSPGTLHLPQVCNYSPTYLCAVSKSGSHLSSGQTWNVPLPKRPFLICPRPAVKKSFLSRRDTAVHPQSLLSPITLCNNCVNTHRYSLLA